MKLFRDEDDNHFSPEQLHEEVSSTREALANERAKREELEERIKQALIECKELRHQVRLQKEEKNGLEQLLLECQAEFNAKKDLLENRCSQHEEAAGMALQRLRGVEEELARLSAANLRLERQNHTLALKQHLAADACTIFQEFNDCSESSIIKTFSNISLSKSQQILFAEEPKKDQLSYSQLEEMAVELKQKNSQLQKTISQMAKAERTKDSKHQKHLKEVVLMLERSQQQHKAVAEELGVKSKELEKLKKLHKAQSSSKEKQDELAKLNKELEGEVAFLRQRLKTSEESKPKGKGKTQLQSVAMHQLNVRLKERQSRIQILSQKLIASDALIQTLRKQQEEILKELAERETALQTMNNRLDSIDQLLQVLAEECSPARVKVVSSQNYDIVSQLHSLLKLQRDKTDFNSAELASARAKCQSLKRQAESREAEADQLAKKATEESSRLLKAKYDLEFQNRQLKESMTKLQNDLKVAEQSSKPREEPKQKDQSHALIQQLRARNACLSEQSRGSEEAKRQLAESGQMLAQAKAQCQNLRKELQSERQRGQDMGQKMTSCSHCKARSLQFQNSRQQIKDYQSLLNALSAKNDELQKLLLKKERKLEGGKRMETQYKRLLFLFEEQGEKLKRLEQRHEFILREREGREGREGRHIRSLSTHIGQISDLYRTLDK